MKGNSEQFLHNPFLNCALSMLNTPRKIANMNSVLDISWHKEEKSFPNGTDVSTEEQEGHSCLNQRQGNSAPQQASVWERFYSSSHAQTLRKMPSNIQRMNWSFATPLNYNATVKEKYSLGPEQWFPISLADKGILWSGERPTSSPTRLPVCLISTILSC